MSSPQQQRRERVVRLLNLLAYIDNHPGSTIMEIARDLHLDPTDVRDDLDLLHLSGVGKSPGEMIDLEHDWTGVTIIDSQGLDKPLRLTPTEANALLLLLESLETMPGLVDRAAVQSAADKIRSVSLGGNVDATRQDVRGDASAILADALATQAQVRFAYYSVTSDSTSQRTVSPINLFHHNGQTYLRAWDGEALKSFRLDRIAEAEILDVPAAAPHSITGIEFDAGDPFGLAAGHTAELKIRRDATWLVEYYDLELDPDAIDVQQETWVPAQMRYGSRDWLVRFALSQADRAQIVAPKEVAEEVRRRAGAAAGVLE